MRTAMITITRIRKQLGLFLAALLAVSLFGACTASGEQTSTASSSQPRETGEDLSRYLVAVEDEPDTVDFQCTTIYYTIATNVFNRLVEMEPDESGNVVVTPSLAESFEESPDGLTYTFRLRDGVTFSNGSALTASDVLYTMKRLLTHPDSCNRDIAEVIKGAAALEEGTTQELEGFTVQNDLEFTITLEEPFEAFLACLSMPGASILDEESTEAAGDRFGKAADATIGTGSFVLEKWKAGEGMILSANESCWEGAPNCAGLDLRFITDSEGVQKLFDEGKLDILDLDELGSAAEYYYHSDLYQDRIYQVPRIGITYIALNESVEPLGDVRVRKALQLGLNRTVLLDAIYSGLGSVENGIFPVGLNGHNPELPEIPYDPEEAKELLAEAGYPEGFDLTISVKSSSTQWEMALMEQAAAMWEKIGVSASIRVMDESEFMKLRKSGDLACYTAMWTADYNDPHNFIYTFFGNRENTTNRSLCYPKEEIMTRVRDARAIRDPDIRIEEYQDLEKIIIQEDAAWIPLFSRLRTYIWSDRVEGVTSSWNGSVKNKYRCITIRDV